MLQLLRWACCLSLGLSGSKSGGHWTLRENCPLLIGFREQATLRSSGQRQVWFGTNQSSHRHMFTRILYALTDLLQHYRPYRRCGISVEGFTYGLSCRCKLRLLAPAALFHEATRCALETEGKRRISIQQLQVPCAGGS